MKLNVNTRLFQGLASKAMKCASCLSDVLITGMMAIEVKNNTLTLTTTNGNIYLYVSEPCPNEDFYVVVDVDVFYKLVSKLTSETMTLEVVRDSLVVTANGKYTIGLPYDSEGELVKYPDKRARLANVEPTTVSASLLKLTLATAKPSLNTTKGYYGCYTGYYLGDGIITTDSTKICLIKSKAFNEPVLIRPDMMNFVELLDDEDVEVRRDDEYLMLKTENCTIYGQILPFLEDFQYDVIKGLCEEEFGYSCQIEKAALLSLLDRLSLFVVKQDENGIYLNFEEDAIRVTSRQDDSTELIHYQSIKVPTTFSCCVDIEKLIDQVKSTLSDVIDLHFGSERALKIVDGNVIKMIALFERG